jgi:hypothetical protein
MKRTYDTETLVRGVEYRIQKGEKLTDGAIGNFVADLQQVLTRGDVIVTINLAQSPTRAPASKRRAPHAPKKRSSPKGTKHSPKENTVQNIMDAILKANNFKVPALAVVVDRSPQQLYKWHGGEVKRLNARSCDMLLNLAKTGKLKIPESAQQHLRALAQK